jgi:DNA-binding MarR family transcriptional regulator
MAKDHVDRFLEQLDGLCDLDFEVEGIVDRIGSLNKRFRRQMDETLADHGMTRPDWEVLKSLRHHGIDACSPGDLSTELELSSGAVTNRLDRLERGGLIVRRPDPADRRGVKLELTPEGERRWTESTNAQAVKEALLASALTKAEQRELNGLLRKLMLAFESEPASEGAAAHEPLGPVADAAA